MESEKNPRCVPVTLPKAGPDWSPLIPQNIEIDGVVWPAVGKGVRFAVYSNGTEVVKIPLSADQLVSEWRSSEDAHGTTGRAEDWERRTRTNVREVRDRLMSGRLPAALLASPMIQRNGWIFQRLLTPLAVLFDASGGARVRDLIDDGIGCVQAGIRCGAMGRFFALPVDFALDQSGRVVMMGLGQLTCDPVLAATWLARKPWRTEASGLHMLPESARAYFIDRMERTFTEAYLTQEWGRHAYAPCDVEKNSPSTGAALLLR